MPVNNNQILVSYKFRVVGAKKGRSSGEMRLRLTIEVDNDVAHHAWQSHELVEGLLNFSFISSGLSSTKETVQY